MSTPHSAASKITPAERKQFAEDVEYYLSLTPRQLPSRYLYDELGSALFDAICHLPWYPITRTELALLAAHGREVFARLNPVSTLVELGPGRGEKLSTLVAAAGISRAMMVHLVDVSEAALEGAGRTLATHPNLSLVRHQAPYDVGLSEAAQAKGAKGATLALFLGSNIGNFDPPGADALLRNIRAALSVGDAFLIGGDLVKPERDLLLAYNDPLGVTAAFNRNLLIRVNRELDADFDVDAFSHAARWNRRASRVEMHLVAAAEQRVRIPAAGLEIRFDAGETIWTESSYKYRPREIVGMLERTGFRFLDQWVDRKGAFALTLVEAM